MIPVNSLSRHLSPLSSQLSAAAVAVIDSGHFVLGPHLSQFETAFAAWCGAEHCVGVANGTDALEIALKALNVRPGDRVGLVANAAMYGTTATLACGAVPVFIDIDPDTHTLCPKALEAALRDGAMAAVIITHLYGRLAAMRELLAICLEHGVPVLEDCAQAHGACDSVGTRAGAFGDIAAFSFYPTKNLGALGDGGAVVTRSSALAARARQLRQYGWSSKYCNDLAGGRNSRLDELQAAMLTVMLPMVDSWNQQRREIANRYSSEISTPALRVPAVSGLDYVAHLFVVQAEDRESVRAALAAKGVQTEVHYPTPDYRQPCLSNSGDFIPLPATEHAAQTVLTLPCFPEMTVEEVGAVIAACNAL